MGKEKKGIITALVCFLCILVLNFLLPRLLPGSPIAYLSGMAEDGLTVAQTEYYTHALHLDESLPRQFLHYLSSIFDGSLGYSFKKEATVSSLIASRVAPTLVVVLPGVFLSALIGLSLGLRAGFSPKRKLDSWLTPLMIVINAIPSFLAALVLVAVFGFRLRILPYAGLSSGPFWDKVLHLVLPVSTLVVAMVPSRYLLVRNLVAREAKERYVLYARQRGMKARTIRWVYILPNISGPFIVSLGMSVGVAVSGSVVIENVFSILGMGRLLTEAVYTLDYPLVQGVLFVTTLVMVTAIIVSDLLALLLDPRRRNRRA